MKSLEILWGVNTAQAVVKLKTELSNGNKVTNITGCSIFLQVTLLNFGLTLYTM